MLPVLPGSILSFLLGPCFCVRNVCKIFPHLCTPSSGLQFILVTIAVLITEWMACAVSLLRSLLSYGDVRRRRRPVGL